VEDFIFDLAKDLQNLRDSVKHIEEEMHHSDEDDDIVVDDNDQHDEASDYPVTVTPSHDPFNYLYRGLRAQREEYIRASTD